MWESAEKNRKKSIESIELFYRKVSLVEKITKNWNFSFNINITVSLESVKLFLHVLFCLKVILTMENYMTLLTIFIWKFAIF